MNQVKKNQQSKSNRKYPKWFYLVLISIPIFILLILEISLRAGNYGKNYSTFVKLPDLVEGYLFFNPELPQKYFSDESVVPSVIPDAFKDIKDSSSFRVFVLGGSSTAGYPYPTNASFTRQLRRRFQLLYPDTNFEVINLGVSAMNSIFMADIIDDVLEQSPDVILVYAGHNEYYGALGAAMTSPLRLPTSFLLTLREVKTYQLIENFLASFKPDKKSSGRTLMGEMAGENLVTLNSDKYYNGLEQFESNLDYILSTCKDADVPVIIGSVTSNLMQKPLDSILDSSSDAIVVYDKAMKLIDGEPDKSKKLFIKSKDLDALRFRAPEEINNIIQNSADNYNVQLIDIDHEFKKSSENGITGFNLFTDHLHPTINGYFFISKLYSESIEKMGLLKSRKNESVVKIADKILKETFPFTRLDSTFAEINLEVLLNSYPFVKNNNNISVLNSYKLENKSDSIAMDVIKGKFGWERAHTLLAEYYYNNKDYESFFKEMTALIYDKPFDTYRYRSTIEYLKEAGQFNLAYTVASLLYNVDRSNYTLKILGQLSFELSNYERALYFLNKVIKIEKNDPFMFLLAAKSYLRIGMPDMAKKILEYSIKLHPNSPEAKRLLHKISSSSANQ